jgi:hypothetical protein
VQETDPRDAALRLLARGLITPHEAAAVCGVSRQRAYGWWRREGVTWRPARARVLARLLAREIAEIEWRRSRRTAPSN